MTFTEAQEAARPAFAQTRAPGLDAVAHALQRAVTNEQNRLAVEVAKAEGRCTDLENKVKKLEAALTASQAREARLREALEPFAACAEVWKKSEKEQVIHVSRRNVRGKDDLVLHVSDLLNAAALRDTARG